MLYQNTTDGLSKLFVFVASSSIRVDDTKGEHVLHYVLLNCCSHPIFHLIDHTLTCGPVQSYFDKALTHTYV